MDLKYINITIMTVACGRRKNYSSVKNHSYLYTKHLKGICCTLLLCTIIFALIFGASGLVFAAEQTKIEQFIKNPVDSLLKELEKVKEDTSKVNIKIEIARKYLNINPEIARQFATDAFNLSTDIKWDKGRGSSILMLGNTYWLVGNNNKAKDYYRRALRIFQDIDYKIGIATALGNIGLIYNDLDQDSLAITYHSQALELDLSLKNYKGVVRHYMNLGVVYSNNGDFSKAIDAYKKSREYAQKVDDKMNEGILLGNIANIFSKLGKAKEVDGYYKEAIDFNLKNGFNTSLAYNYVNYGLYLLTKKHRYKEVIEYGKKALILNESLKDAQMDLNLKSMLVTAYTLAGEFEKAEEYIKEIKKYPMDLMTNADKIEILTTIGNFYYLKVLRTALKMSPDSVGRDEMTNILLKSTFTLREQESLNLARQTWKQATTWFLKKHYSENYAVIYYRIAILDEYFKDYQSALYYKSKFSTIRDSLFSKENILAVSNLENHLAIEKKDKQLQIAELRLQKSNLSRMFIAVALTLSVLLLVTFILLYRSNYSKSQRLTKVNKEISEINTLKDKLFSIIAHDLINPISNFKSMMAVLVNDFDSFEKQEQKEYLSLMASASDSLLEMLKNLLDWSRMQSNKVEPHFGDVTISHLINQNIGVFTLSAQNKNIELIDETDGSLSVYCDYNLMTTVVRNLVSNAIKFTPNGGKIFFRTEKQITKNENFVVLKIKDTGVGVPPEKVKDLFSFNTGISTQGTNSEKGTGLGLVLCRDFMEIQNGEIVMESVLAQGTTMILKIPMSESIKQENGSL